MIDQRSWRVVTDKMVSDATKRALDTYHKSRYEKGWEGREGLKTKSRAADQLVRDLTDKDPEEVYRDFRDKQE